MINKRYINILTIIIISVGVAYIYIKWDLFSRLFDMGWIQVAVIISSNIFNTLVGALPNKLILSKYKLKLKFSEWYGIFVWASLLNYLPLKAGLFTKAVYLKKRHSLSLGDFSSMTGLTYAITLLNKGFIGLLVSTLLLILDGNNINVVIPIIFLIIIIIMAFILWSDIGRYKFKSEIITKIQNIFANMRLRNSDIRPVLLLIIFINVAIVFDGLKYYLILSYFNVSIGFFNAMLVAIGASLSTVISITPGNIGLKELIAGLMMVGLGETMDNGIILSVVDRMFFTIILIIMGSIFGYIISKPIQKNH